MTPSAVDVVSSLAVLLVGVYVILRKFRLSDGEFISLSVVLAAVLSICVIHRRVPPDASVDGFADPRALGVGPPSPSLSDALSATRCSFQGSVRRVVDRLYPAFRAAHVERFVDDLFKLPGKVSDILEPRVASISRGFKGEPTAPIFTFVGDGKQKDYDRQRERSSDDAEDDALYQFQIQDFYRDPSMRRSDAQFRRAKAELEAKREAERREAEETRKNRQVLVEEEMPEFAKRSLLQDGNAGEEGAEGGEDKQGQGGGVLDFSRTAFNQQIEQEEASRAAKAAQAAPAAAAEETDDDGHPLRFDVAKFRDMVDGIRRADFALCRVKSRDRDSFEALLRLDWLRTYQEEKQARRFGNPPGQCRDT